MKKLLATLLFGITLVTGLAESARAQLNKPYFFYLGREYIIAGRYREAIDALNMLLRTETKEYEGYFLRGVAKYNLDDLLGAEADFTRAVEENPVYTLAYQYRAITRSRMGNYEEGLQDYNAALELRPSLSPVYFSRGVTYFLNQQFEAAAADFTQYLKNEPTDVNALTNRGTCYLYLKDTVRAYADFNRAVAVNPRNAEGYFRRGILEVSQHNYDQGIADLDRAAQLNDRWSPVFFYRARAKAAQNKVIEALADMNRAIDCDTTNSVAYFNRALLLGEIGDYSGAIADYDRVALYNPGNVLVVFNRASVKARIGDLRGAIADYTRAIELYPDFANAYLRRADLKAQLRDTRGAETDRRTAKTKIEAYRNQLADRSFSEFADTSRQMNQMLSFDADFGDNPLQAMTSDARRDARLLPLFRVTIVPQDTVALYTQRNYYNERQVRLLGSLAGPAGYTFALGTPASGSVPTDSIAAWDTANDKPETWEAYFRKGLTQSALTQYTSAMSYYTRSLHEKGDNPYTYLNRAVTQAEMIEFISSLAGKSALQTIAIGENNDPAARLLQGESRPTYDYSEAIRDLRRAADLMPELPYVYYNLANLYCLSGDLPGAIDLYTQAIERWPEFAEAYYNRGLVQIFLRDVQKGCMDISKAGELGLQDAYRTLRVYCIKK